VHGRWSSLGRQERRAGHRSHSGEHSPESRQVYEVRDRCGGGHSNDDAGIGGDVHLGHWLRITTGLDHRNKREGRRGHRQRNQGRGGARHGESNRECLSARVARLTSLALDRRSATGDGDGNGEGFKGVFRLLGNRTEGEFKRSTIGRRPKSRPTTVSSLSPMRHEKTKHQSLHQNQAGSRRPRPWPRDSPSWPAPAQWRRPTLCPTERTNRPRPTGRAPLIRDITPASPVGRLAERVEVLDHFFVTNQNS
jgi:hypothetical protein